MAILFGGTGRSQSKNLVEFRAGKMKMVGTTVHPDKRKGLLYVYQADDSLMHFCWKDRGTGNIEDDLIIFPDDVEYKRIPQCTTGRVYLLKFKSSSRRIFFWMQEPKTDKDEDYAKKINDVLNNPPPLGSSRSGGSTPGADISNLESLLSGDADLQSLISGMNQQQLRNLLGASNLGSLFPERSMSTSPSSPSAHSTAPAPVTTAPPVTPTPTPATAMSTASSRGSTATTPTSSSQTIQLSQLQNILSGIRVPAADGQPQDIQSPADIDLAAMSTADFVQPIIANPEFIERLQSMLPQTGEEVSTAQQIQETLQSPQFQQALSAFSAAMQSGQLAPLVSQFGLRQEQVRAAAQGADMESFVRALQSALQGSTEETASADKDEKEGAKSPDHKDDDDEDENMAVD